MKTLVIIFALLPCVTISQSSADACPSWGAGGHKNKPAQPDFLAANRVPSNASVSQQERLANFAIPKYKRTSLPNSNIEKKTINQIQKKSSTPAPVLQEFEAMPINTETEREVTSSREIPSAPIINDNLSPNKNEKARSEAEIKNTGDINTTALNTNKEEEEPEVKRTEIEKNTKHKAVKRRTKVAKAPHKKACKGNNQKCPEF